MFTQACIAGIKTSQSVLMLTAPRAADPSSDMPKLPSVSHNSGGRPQPSIGVEVVDVATWVARESLRCLQDREGGRR